MEAFDIRPSVPADYAAIESLYPSAFPDEDLVPLVRTLLQDSEVVLSLVGTIQSRVVAHVVFTYCGVSSTSARAALLGPLAVMPDSQGRGLGSAIVRDGLQRLRSAGVTLVMVLGDPAYYSRFGFVPDALIEPPYVLPREWGDAWQSRYLIENAAPCEGKLSVPAPWRQPKLWAP